MLLKAISKIYSTFLSLLDTPSSYSGQGGKFVKVNVGETGLEFGTGGTSIDIDFRDYAPAANGQKVSDAGITSGLATLTSATGLFVSGDVGKSCVVTGAGAAGVNLHTTVAGYTNSTTITLTASASTTVSGANFSWGTDDTAKFQAAIDAADALKNGRIIVPRGRYYTTGFLNLKRCAIVGATSGPIDSPSINPGKTTVGTTFLITNETTPFLSDSSWHEPKIENLIFYYPNQNYPTATAPIVYPYTVDLSNEGIAGFVCKGCFFVNSYNAIKLFGGRHKLYDLNIGAFNIGIFVDHSRDVIRIKNIQMNPFWNSVNGIAGVGQNLDLWALANARGLVIHSADQVMIQSFFAFWKHIGIEIDDSLDTGQASINSYGQGSDINIDWCQYGVVAKSTNQTGGASWDFSNLSMAGSGTVGIEGVSAMSLPTGGTGAPNVTWVGGTTWGTFTGSILDVQAGKCRHQGVRTISDTFKNFPNTGSTLSVAAGNLFKATNSASRTISSFSNGYLGQEIEVVFTTAANTLNETGNIRLTGTTSLIPAAGDSHRFRYDNTVWWHIGGGGSADLASFGIDGGAYSDTYISTANVDAGAY